MHVLKRNRPTIGVLAGWQTYPGTIHTFLDHLFRGIKQAARDSDCNLLFGCAANTPFYNYGHQVMPIPLDGADFIPVGPWNTDGIVVAAPLFFEPANRYFQDLIDADFPIIYAGDRETSPSVVVDNEGGIQLAVDHLVAHNHRRIAFIAGHHMTHGDSMARLRGYQSGLKRHGLNYDPDLVAFGEHVTETSYLAMKEIIERGKPFSAVIASNDEAAVGVIQALRDFGLVVPQDVAVIGFDDRLEARAQVPLLTSIHHPMFELGYQSLELLVQIIKGEKPADSLIQIPTHLVIRESCGCLPGNQPLPTSPSIKVDDQVLNVYYPDFHGPIRYGAAPVIQDARPSRKKIFPDVANEMAGMVHREMHRMGRPEVEYLCQRLLQAFILSLDQNDVTAFQLAMQQILEHAASLDGDLHAWHGALSVLRKWTPALLDTISPLPASGLAENLLHQARIAISEILRGQYSRLVMHEASVANLISQMSTRFFSAKCEADIFQILSDFNEPLNIQNTSVFYYKPQASDPYALSEVKAPVRVPEEIKLFPTRQFPPDGFYPDEHPFELVLLPLFKPDGMLGYITFQTNQMAPLGQIVRQLMAALHNVSLYQETVEARKQAEQANEMKSRFLSIVSHELRTPLSLIFGLSNMMLEESEEVNQEERLVNTKDLNRIYIGAQHLESLIRDVLDLARSDVGQLKLMMEPVDLREVLESVAAIGEQLAHDKDLEWHKLIPSNLPPVQADRTRLRQIILNLVNNAVKFTLQGSITLSAHTENGHVTITVRDTGLGIPKKDQCAIFDEYIQSRRTTTRGYGGLGLGLAICKRLVEMQGGSIGVSSSGKEGSGSVFYFSLPIYENTTEADHHPADSSGQRILILAKELASSSNLQNYLANQGFDVDLYQVRLMDDWLPRLNITPPDRIILDLEITSERGWEILKTIKENPSTRDIPLLFFDLKNEQNQGALLDLNFMTKPINSSDLAGEMTARGLPLISANCGASRPILIVDDDPEILNLHTRIVETVAGGYPIMHASNGHQALNIIRQERPALVLLDLMMPEVDGFEVLETMQAEDLIRSSQVIVLTNQALTEEDMARLNCGVASVLGKGMFSAKETLAHVRDALACKRRTGTEAHRMTLKAIAYLHTNYMNQISRSDIASYIGTSERHLSRFFQQEVGITPITYLNRLRVKIAKTLLENNQLTITQIAMEVGFSTGGYFTRVFREEEGISPREYQRNQSSN